MAATMQCLLSNCCVFPNHPRLLLSNLLLPYGFGFIFYLLHYFINKKKKIRRVLFFGLSDVIY